MVSGNFRRESSRDTEGSSRDNCFFLLTVNCMLRKEAFSVSNEF